jgi:hypothetical protein
MGAGLWLDTDTVGEIDDQAPQFGAGFPAEHRRPDGHFGIRQQRRIPDRKR